MSGYTPEEEKRAAEETWRKIEKRLPPLSLDEGVQFTQEEIEKWERLVTYLWQLRLPQYLRKQALSL